MTTEMMVEAKRLHLMGFALLPLMPKSKRPTILGWTSGPRLNWNEFIKIQHPQGNIGVRTGEASKIGNGYLGCIDLDVKNPEFKEEAYKALAKIVGSHKCPMALSGSGKGSCHNYFKSLRPFKMITIVKNENYEICIYSTGRQMVLPPSVTTGQYKWVNAPKSTDDFPLMSFEALEGDVNSNLKGHSKASKPKDAPFPIEFSKVDLGWLGVSESTRAGIKDCLSISNRSDFLMTACRELLSAGLTRDEVLSVLTDPENKIHECAKERRGANRAHQADWLWNCTLKKVIDERSFKTLFGEKQVEKKLSDAEIKEQSKELTEDRNWRQDLDKTIEHKKAKCTLKNLDLILTNTIQNPLFKKDLFANRIAYGVTAPWGPKENDYVQDIDIILIKRWLGGGEFNIEPSKDAIYEVTDLIAHNLRVHPVREWLSSLKWDGKPRINTWIKDYCEGRAEEPYLSEVSRKFLMALVKRVFEPGCQWDYTLVLEGAQGKYKSTIARTLVGDKWFMDNLPDLRDKDAMTNLQGKWLIELGELTNVKRSDSNIVKQYLVRRIDTVRAHYGRIASDVPRQSVFIGTVNDGQYLKDPTGNRRFWPVKVGLCDVKGLRKVREQLFAETMTKYKDEVLMLTEEANAQALEAQNDRRIDDDNVGMEDALYDFINSEKSKNFKFEDFRTRDLILGIEAPWGEWGKNPYVQQIAAQVLKTMGFEHERDNTHRFWRITEEVKIKAEKRVTHPPKKHQKVTEGVSPFSDDFYKR